MRTDIARGTTKGQCSCRTNMPESRKHGTGFVGQMDYKTLTPLPLFLTPDQKQPPIGWLEPTAVEKVDQYYKNNKFAVVIVDQGIKLYVPYHENYFFP